MPKLPNVEKVTINIGHGYCCVNIMFTDRSMRFNISLDELKQLKASGRLPDVDLSKIEVLVVP